MYTLFISHMTTSAITPVDNSALLAEFSGGTSTDVSMMIGIGLVKDSEAVFFQYLGDEQTPSALMMPSGRPLTRLANVTLAGIDVADDIGEFKSTKLNLFLQSSQGRVVMLTSGLTTIWSQCLLTSLMGMYHSYDLQTPFQLDSWKGTSKLRPCFAAIRCGGAKVSDLRDLQGLVVEALSTEIKSGMQAGEVNQTAIKNALQLCRDNNIVAVDDTMNDFDRLASMIPNLTPVETTYKSYI